MLNSIRTALAELDGTAAMAELNETGVLKLTIEGSEIELTKEDLLISTAQKEGYVAAADKGYTVVVDTNLTEELLEEGFVREIISKIQTMRKEADFEVQDHIQVAYTGNDKVAAIMAKNADYIASEVLANSVSAGSVEGYTKDWKINGEEVTFSVKKA